MNQRNAHRVIQDFGASIGLPDLAFNSVNLCSLSFDDLVVNLGLSPDADHLSAHIWLAALEPEDHAEACRVMAEANYLMTAVHGACIGMSRQSGDVVLSARMHEQQLTLSSLQQWLQDLLNLAQSWRGRLAALPCNPSARPQATLPAEAPAGLRV